MTQQTLFLTHAELVELTGYRMTFRRIKWLSITIRHHHPHAQRRQ